MNRRLRVGIVVPGWSGPGETAALPALADLLWTVARDHDLRIVTLRHPARREAYHDLGGVPVTALGLGTRGGPLGRAAVLAAGVRAVRAGHRWAPFDVLHGFWADEPGAVAVTAGRLLGVPAVMSVMGGELVALPEIGYGSALGRGGRWTVAASLRDADLVTVGASSLFRTVASQAPEVPLLRLPLGVDLMRFSPAAVPPEASRVLFVGSLTPVKDPVLLLRAFAQVRRRGAELVVAGDGPLRAGLERLCVTLGIDRRVRFLGTVPRTALPELVRSARVLVVTSRHEAQSMVAVEAAASGIPVVGTPVGVLPELARAGGGVAIEGRDPARLAAAIDEALGQSGTPLGEAGRRHAIGAWDLAGSARTLIAAWQELVEEPDTG